MGVKWGGMGKWRGKGQGRRRMELAGRGHDTHCGLQLAVDASWLVF